MCVYEKGLQKIKSFDFVELFYKKNYIFMEEEKLACEEQARSLLKCLRESPVSCPYTMSARDCLKKWELARNHCSAYNVAYTQCRKDQLDARKRIRGSKTN